MKQGKSIFVVPGGEKEQLLSKLDKHTLWINDRKGFCKLAVEFGIPIIPHYNFGETSMYTTKDYLFNLRWWICSKFHIAIPIAFGYLNLPFPFIIEILVKNESSLPLLCESLDNICSSSIFFNNISK